MALQIPDLIWMRSATPYAICVCIPSDKMKR
jgi:hypothetical protein